MHTISFRQFIEFLNGRGPRFICVGILPNELVTHLGTKAAEIHLQYDYARKLWERHNLTPQHYYAIGRSLEHGECRADKGDLVFFYDDSALLRTRFKLVIKTTVLRNETWVKTFHRLNAFEFKRQSAKCELIRPAPKSPSDGAMRLGPARRID